MLKQILQYINIIEKNGYTIYNKVEEFNGKQGIVIYGKEIGKKHRTLTNKKDQLVILSKNVPIISSKDFLYVQEKLEMNKKNTTAKKQGKYTWLTGILKCKNCNHSVGVKANKKYKYLMCSKHRLYKACNNTISYKLEDVEKIVYDKISSYLLNLDLDKISKKNNDIDITENLNKLNVRKIDIQKQIENLINAIATGTKLNDILENKINELNLELKEVENKISKEMIKINNNTTNINIDLYKKSINLFLNNFNEMDIEDKASLVKIFVKEIFINAHEIEIIKNL